MDQTSIKTLYIFVEIGIDSNHLEETIRMNFPDDRNTFHRNLLEFEVDRARIPIGTKIGVGRNLLIENGDSQGDPPIMSLTSSPQLPTRLALVSTIQFVSALQRLKENLSTTKTGAVDIPGPAAESPKFWTGMYEATIPRSKPLSPGEILGCTAPRLMDVDALVYVCPYLCPVDTQICSSYLGDGRFHLESIMISNPDIPAFRYDPYSKKLTRERYDHEKMRLVRENAVQSARQSLKCISENGSVDKGFTNLWGVVLGTLGRQGNVKQLQVSTSTIEMDLNCILFFFFSLKAITHQLEKSESPVPYVQILLSELSPAKLALFHPHIATFVQTSCPRLSIDWGYAFEKPLLSPYEMAVAVGKLPSWMDKTAQDERTGIYPMDFYAANSPWAISRIKATFDI